MHGLLFHRELCTFVAMKDKFICYIEEHDLICPNDRILLCISGGVDSMVLLRLFVECYGVQRIVVAHCNFMLRGEQSDAETAMVLRVCGEYGVECHHRYFDTKAECARSGDSVQIVARRLRYDWFDSLAQEYDYTKIATAHHSDDSTETFFINLLRGTGLRGLTGIGRSRGRIIRPLLFASRGDIESYAMRNSVEYKTDSSNSNLDYLRSRLRHDILPRFASSSSSFLLTMAANIERLSAAQAFIDKQIEQIALRVFEGSTLNLDRLKEMDNWHFLLFELLRPYGYSGEVVEDISQATHSGKRFYSASHCATLDRGSLIIVARGKTEDFEERELHPDDTSIEWIDPASLQSLHCPKNEALLSADALQFPLQLRRWRHGDWFVPLGMQSPKKVSDLLIDGKVPLTEKENQGVLVSGEDSIVWVVGRRIDDRYKITESTVRAIRVVF